MEEKAEYQVSDEELGKYLAKNNNLLRSQKEALRLTIMVAVEFLNMDQPAAAKEMLNGALVNVPQ